MTQEEQLAELHARLAGCHLCLDAGHDIYPRAIYSGKASARMMSIGQAPGITEKEVGRPFNAGSGTRLFKWLAQAGIDEAWFRQTQYMSSITKCYPGKGKAGGDRVPSPAEQALCRPHLEAELRIINPEVVILIGKLAITTFYPVAGPLDQIIGTQQQANGRWWIPLPHPSGASRWHQTTANQALIEQAIGLIREHALRLFGSAPRS